MQTPTLLTPRETADRLKVSTRTLERWRVTGTPALPYVRIGGRVFYEPDAVAELIKSGRRVHT